jgi:hypothetical protein
MDVYAATDIVYKWIESPSENESEIKIKIAVDTLLDYLYTLMPNPYEEDE